MARRTAEGSPGDLGSRLIEFWDAVAVTEHLRARHGTVVDMERVRKVRDDLQYVSDMLYGPDGPRWRVQYNPDSYWWTPKRTFLGEKRGRPRDEASGLLIADP